MAYAVDLDPGFGEEPSVRDQVLALPRELQRTVANRLIALGEEPRPPGFEKIEGDAYRIFHAGCRITYLIDDANHAVNVLRVARDIPLPD